MGMGGSCPPCWSRRGGDPAADREELKFSAVRRESEDIGRAARSRGEPPSELGIGTKITKANVGSLLGAGALGLELEHSYTSSIVTFDSDMCSLYR